jgi:hypothetical protein
MGPTILKALTLVVVVVTFGSGSPGPSLAAAPTSQIPVAPTSAVEASGDNLVVVVPPVPPTRSLRKLCLIFLSHSWQKASVGTSRGNRKDASLIAELIAVTGGTNASTTAWCNAYLHRRG